MFEKRTRGQNAAKVLKNYFNKTSMINSWLLQKNESTVYGKR